MFRRVAVCAYGVACYAVFFATFLYAIGFVGGFGVPRGLDALGDESPAWALLIDGGLLALFAVQHSMMARPAFKRAVRKFIPDSIERSTYVLASSGALILLFWQWRPIGGRIWQVEDPIGRAALYTVFAGGWLTVLGSTFLINHFDLFGLRQVWLYAQGKPYTALAFRTPGAYRMVRHPIYVGWLVAFWATPTMTVAHLFFALATTAYILGAIRLEERDLLDAHGTLYSRYRDEVPMLIPRRPTARRRVTRRTPSRSSAL
jgi:methanethiol S-methyltransferase